VIKRVADLVGAKKAVAILGNYEDAYPASVLFEPKGYLP
jgi:hypothetical protein